MVFVAVHIEKENGDVELGKKIMECFDPEKAPAFDQSGARILRLRPLVLSGSRPDLVEIASSRMPERATE